MKLFTDPVYGYIAVEDYFIPLIDTPEYQRLRNIFQTGYQALYPSAFHNRFVHSLGVFHLGEKAFICFRRNVCDSESNLPKYKNWGRLQKSFLCACLLHDVGHSPFSHSGEDLYKKSTDFRLEFKKIFPKSVDFIDYIEQHSKPHEAMSALIGLGMLRECKVQGIDKELFIRAITGAKYQSGDEYDISIKNAVIEMLNGSIIDVDKLDYLLRDAYVTGYNTIT